MDNIKFLSYVLTFLFFAFIGFKIYFKLRRLRIERNADKILKEMNKRDKNL